MHSEYSSDPSDSQCSYKVSRASDFRDEANSLRAQASTLDDSLSSSLREISSLESECSSLEWLIESRTAAIASHTAAQASHLRQITAAADAAEDISSLQAHAADTKRSVLEALPSLRGVRDALESVSVVVKEKALEVEVAAPASTLIERIADLRPGGGGPTARKRRRDAQRQLEALKCMTETLERVSAGLPALLEGGKIQLKQLDMSWEAQKQAEMKAIAARVPGAWKEG